MAWDVAIIGAGVAGLVCAQRLHQAGYNVLVLEKSRGLGGRAATRRLEKTCADHGLRYLTVQGELTQSLIDWLRSRGVWHRWTGLAYRWSAAQGLAPDEPPHRYVAVQGMNQLGKLLAEGLEVWRGQRVITIADRALWALGLESMEGESSDVQARAVVVAIPAPQAEVLLSPLVTQKSEAIAALQQVEYAPCISAIALYDEALVSVDGLAPLWQSVEPIDHPELTWISRETTKREGSGQAVVVVHSTPAFAARHLESNAMPEIGMQLLQAAGTITTAAIAQPTMLQVHRWRYAVPNTPYPKPYLHVSLPLPLVCCGDWAGGATVEAALRSGVLAAECLNWQLDQRTLPNADVWNSMKQVDRPSSSL